jgi:hypothetical protein
MARPVLSTRTSEHITPRTRPDTLLTDHTRTLWSSHGASSDTRTACRPTRRPPSFGAERRQTYHTQTVTSPYCVVAVARPTATPTGFSTPDAPVGRSDPIHEVVGEDAVDAPLQGLVLALDRLRRAGDLHQPRRPLVARRLTLKDGHGVLDVGVELCLAQTESGTFDGFSIDYKQ